MNWINLWQACAANDNAGAMRVPHVRSVFIVTPDVRALAVIAGRAAPANDTRNGSGSGDNPEVAR